MRRGIAANTVAGKSQDGFKIGAGGTLAIGTAHNDDRTVLALTKFRLDPAHTLQPQLNARLPPGMQAFEVVKPD
ncbi:MAG: hypothetical protein BWY57_01885 [Betaproteobacteria bacterium ADurb.Bin341]|nr:MAG: hypothetical protein BWY57_01885 [Betaproteobacteria bacterium ADurb.Bin341]